ncbi:DUF3592 domain-containing protein [Flavisphingomonas formosensis]|uniref:DUF3592 domain-containing protein n=1 Tax=Flavisphingomonas formosensis TaxID=861534 RepID=UPI0012FC1008
MRKKSLLEAMKGLSALTTLALLVSFPLMIIGHLAMVEHDRRIQLIRNGETAHAIVTDSKSVLRSCLFRYRFQLQNVTYEGGKNGGCKLISQKPVGSVVIVRFDPRDPTRSIAVGGDLWPGWAIVPVLIGLPILFVWGVAAYSVIGNAFSPRRRGKRAERRS